MIKKIESFDYFEDEAYTIWDDRKDGIGEIRMCDGVYLIENNTYPKYFEYEEAFDPHCCGDWYECSSIDYQNYLAESIEEKYAEIKKLKDMLTKDKNG